MKWYTGQIAEAVSEAKSKGAIFVVYIEGDDDKSKDISALFDTGVLKERTDTDNFVAIKIQAGSLPHQQFSEFYREPTVPSVYFIGKDGRPLDIIKGSDDLENLTPRIDSILSKAEISVKPEIPVAQIQEKLPDSDIVCENGVCRIVPEEDKENTEATTSSVMNGSEELTPEEKVLRAKELIELKRGEKEREEKENERQKEIERRKMGQNVQEMKRWQKDQEMKQLMEDREKEKREEKLARERVLAQIKQDREERLSKSQPLSPTTENAPKPPSPSPPPTRSNTTRLQFKLPDGSSNTKEFEISDTLQSVIGYIKENLNLPFSNFILSTTFPRREFSSEDYSQSLLDLQLIPNAVILILPQHSGVVSSSRIGGTLTTILWSLFSPILGVFDYLKGLIFGKTRSTSGTKRSSDDMGEPRPSNPKRRMMRDSTVVKRQGNIHRLTDRDDSDDEGNTWNGNSTQQM